MIKFTNIGKEYSRDREEAILKAIDAMADNFEEFKGQSVGFMQGEALKGIIKEFNIPARRYCLTGHIKGLDSYGFYGVEGKYKNGTFKTYFIDNGCECCPIALEEVPQNV